MIILHLFSKYYTKIIYVLVFAALVVSRVSAYNQDYNNTLESSANITEINNVTAQITSYPVYEKERTVFEAKITDSKQKELLNTFHKIYYKAKNKPQLHPGDTVVISGSRQIPSLPTNIGAFDSKSYYKSENIHGNIFAKKVNILKENSASFSVRLYNMRQKFLTNADKHFGDEYSGIVKALVTGDRTSISNRDSEALKKSGVYHIVAISGLHLNIFIMIFSQFIAKLNIKRFRKAVLSFALCFFVGLFVLLFTGFGLSVIRAFVMLVISLGSSVFARKYNSKNSLFLSAVFIIIFIPSSFFNVGFRLSVLSTYGVLLSGDIVNKLKEMGFLKSKLSAYVAGTFVTSVVCMVVTLPITMNSFGYVSVYSPIANLVILPLMTPALCGCIIFGVGGITGFGFVCNLLKYPVSIIICVILKMSRLISDAPCSTLNIYPEYTLPILAGIITAVFAVYLFIKSKKITAIATAMFLCVANVGYFMYNNTHSDAKVVFADVDQGDCAIVSLPNGNAIMFDFGTNSDINYMADEIKATLRKLNIKKLSAAFVSHFHKDHVSGITEITGDGLAEKILVPEYYDTDDEESIFYRRQLMAVCEKTNTPVIKIKSGDRLFVGDAVLNVFTPTDKIKHDANDMSAVVKMSYGDVDFLFTGDISKKVMKALYPCDIECDVIKVAHHGSKNSADKIFIEKADPEYAVISCSANNTYGHPHKQTTDLLAEKGAEIFRTDKMGAVILSFDKEKIKSIKTMR